VEMTRKSPVPFHARTGLILTFVAAVALLLLLSAPAGANMQTVIAWVPSHQDDTGVAWHEYVVCGDITQRAMALLPDFINVRCWELGMGLTTNNHRALQSEVDQANAANADCYIGIHVDSGAPSGILGVYFTGDSNSANYAAALARSIAASMGMTYRGLYHRLVL